MVFKFTWLICEVGTNNKNKYLKAAMRSFDIKENKKNFMRH